MVFYHATTEHSLPNIEREGLLPHKPEAPLNYQPSGVYLWRHYDDAAKCQTIIIVVDIPEHWVTEDWEMDSDDNGESRAVVCHTVIPRNRIVAITAQRWI